MKWTNSLKNANQTHNLYYLLQIPMHLQFLIIKSLDKNEQIKKNNEPEKLIKTHGKYLFIQS